MFHIVIVILHSHSVLVVEHLGIFLISCIFFSSTVESCTQRREEVDMERIGLALYSSQMEPRSRGSS